MQSSDHPGSGDAVDALRFEGVYREHEPAVRRYAARRVPADRVDDVVHEAFLAAWRRLDDVPAQPLPWLLGVARNCVLHDRRSRARQGKLDERLSEQPCELEAPQLGDPELAAALRALPARDRELLSLLAWEGLSVAEAARALGVNAVAARVRLHRARRRLADLLHAERSAPRAAATPSLEEIR